MINLSRSRASKWDWSSRSYLISKTRAILCRWPSVKWDKASSRAAWIRESLCKMSPRPVRSNKKLYGFLSSICTFAPIRVYIYICMTCVIAKDSNSRRNIHETWRLKSLHFSLFKIVKSNSLSFLFYVSLFVRQTMRARWNANWKNLLSAIP